MVQGGLYTELFIILDPVTLFKAFILYFLPLCFYLLEYCTQELAVISLKKGLFFKNRIEFNRLN